MKSGYSYHIKDSFFDLVDDPHLMANKEDGRYRPHFYAVQDRKYSELYWMIPISSKVRKYQILVDKKMKRYGKCNTIVIGRFAGCNNAFLIQNAFPIIEEFIDHEHTIENRPVTIHKKLEKCIISNLREVLALYDVGVPLIFSDINKIKEIMLNRLDSNNQELLEE